MINHKKIGLKHFFCYCRNSLQSKNKIKNFSNLFNIYTDIRMLISKLNEVEILKNLALNNKKDTIDFNYLVMKPMLNQLLNDDIKQENNNKYKNQLNELNQLNNPNHEQMTNNYLENNNNVNNQEKIKNMIEFKS
jgi:hypothetical protein